MIQARRMDEFRDLKTRNQLGRRKKQVQVLEDKRRARNKEHYLEALSITLSYLALSLPYLIHLIFSQKGGVSYQILSPKFRGSRSLKTCNKPLKLSYKSATPFSYISGA